MRSPLNYLTPEEYLSAEQHSEIRHEYVAGSIFAMAGASEEHNIIVLNIGSLLRSHLRGTSCRAFITDMKVKLKVANVDIFYYPDLLVTCNPEDGDRYYKSYPKLIIEVLSESTETIDKREKRINYQSIDSLEEYILVSQDKINIEIYRKEDNGQWSVRVIHKDEELLLQSIDLTLTMKEVYEDVFFF